MYNNEDNDYMNNNSDNNSRNYENVEPDNNQSTGTTGYTTYKMCIRDSIYSVQMQMRY